MYYQNTEAARNGVWVLGATDLEDAALEKSIRRLARLGETRPPSSSESLLNEGAMIDEILFELGVSAVRTLQTQEKNMHLPHLLQLSECVSYLFGFGFFDGDNPAEDGPEALPTFRFATDALRVEG